MKMIMQPQKIFDYMAKQNLRWADAIAEVIDNAFDAGAMRVDIRINTSQRWWEVDDDGGGCADITKMLPLGSHAPTNRTEQPLGMYGVGLKDAWMFSGDRIAIETVHKGQRGFLDLKTEDVTDEWEAPDPEYSETKAADGTRIRFFLRRGKHAPKDAQWDAIRWMFTPAILEGRQITIAMGRQRKRPMKAFDLPPFVDSVEDEFDVEGKRVSMVIGIAKDGHRITRGPFWITYGHRVVRGSSIGCGGYSALRMAGRIALGKGWSLTKNKDDLADYQEELEREVFKRIEPLLIKHEHLAQQVESSELKREIEAMFDAAIKEARKEKRESPKNNVGRIMPKNTGRKRGFNKSQPGKSGGQKPRKGFTVDWMDVEPDVIGEYDSLDNVVRLNLSHPFIGTSKDSGNAPALYSVAVAIISHDACSRDATGNRLLFESGSFSDIYARIMRTMPATIEKGEANVG